MPGRDDARKSRVSYRQIGPALLMLVGILIVVMGYIQDGRLLLYSGLIITLAGVLTGVVSFLLPEQTRENKRDGD